MASIPELRVDGLHPDHVGPLQAALAQARERLAAVESGEDQGAGSPWDTETVTSWVSPNIKKNKEES